MTAMQIHNRIDKVCAAANVKNAYQFWRDTALGQVVAYKLYNDRTAYPNQRAMEAICRAYRVQPGDVLEVVEDWRERDSLVAVRGVSERIDGVSIE